jgi:hypothetical protein
MSAALGLGLRKDCNLFKKAMAKALSILWFKKQRLWEPLKIQSSPKCKAWKKFRRATYVLYVSKKFFSQRSITSHLVAVSWQLSGMAITNGLVVVSGQPSQMASSFTSSSISWDEMWIFRGSLMKQAGSHRLIATIGRKYLQLPRN